MWSPYQSLCHTPVLSATAKNTKPFFSLPGALLIRHRWSLITLRSQIFIASVGPPVAGNSLHCFFTCPSSQKATEISFFSPVEDREEHLLYWRRTSYPPPCCSIAQLCLTVTPWTAAHQASLSFTISWNSSLGKLQTIFFFPSCDLSFQGQTMGKTTTTTTTKKTTWSKHVSFLLGISPFIVSFPTGKSPHWLTKLIWWTLSLFLL